jgi:murein DD-endopeptidase MepM/ murein hydrolase activator NlpD
VKENIHTIIKVNKKSGKKEGSLLLLFVLFFFGAFVYFTATEALFSEKNEKCNLENGNVLFLFPEEEMAESKGIISFTEENFILAESPPCFIKPQTLGVLGNEERENIISYKVESGDNVSGVANKFGISPDTIRWANDIKGNTLKEGDELLILPTTGVMYYVEKGDTLSQIAKIHKAKAEDIVEFNDIDEKKIIAGDRLIIPGGTPPPPPPPARVTSSARIVQSSFINPVPGGMITQRTHSYNAVDIYNHCGSPIVAAAAGRVTQVGRGSWPAGNFVKIDHGSVVILYAHMQSIYVNVGDYVSQGKQIGTVGNTGKTIGRTGCHLHFDVLSLKIRNPFAHLPIGARP